jgi:hypothetical protein
MHASDSQTVLSGGSAGSGGARSGSGGRVTDPLSVSCRVSAEDDEGCTFELLGPAGVSRLWRAETAQECSAWVCAIKRWVISQSLAISPSQILEYWRLNSLSKGPNETSERSKNDLSYSTAASHTPRIWTREIR